MKASETNLTRFLAQSNTQFIIPVYQRNYDWTVSQCKQLIDDILIVGADSKTNAHFIGSIVYIHDDVYSTSGIRELSIIDGQQRLTTITLIYLVLHRLANKMEKFKLRDRINEQYLINKFDEDQGSKLKLRPTENNNKALRYLLRSDDNEEFLDYSRLVENFNYFRGRITDENYETVLLGIEKLMFVEISLDREKDDPQKIFESLNSTGLELSQADLIRNYILMGLKRKKQIVIYQKYWEIIENLAKHEKSNKSKVSGFIRDYLTIKSKKIPNKNKVYLEFKSNFSIKNYDELEIRLADIRKLAHSYNKLLNPQNETDLDIRKQIYYINKLEINVSYPFLMQIYEDYSSKKISKTEFIKVCQLIQSFVWRRFILGLPTNALNKIFQRLYEDSQSTNYVDTIAISLLKKKGNQRFPRNNEILKVLKEKDLYNIQSKNRTYYFEIFENFNNKEPVMISDNANITIEHIFPQNPEPKWKLILGEEEYNLIRNNFLNTPANLTLSGNNGKLSNKYFTEKRDMNKNKGEQGYKYSRLWMNRHLATIDKWDIEELNHRAKIIEDRFLEIWPFPNVDFEEDDFIEVNIFDADDPTGKKLEYAIFFNQKIEFSTVTDLYKHIITELFELQPQSFFTSSLKEKLTLTKSSKKIRMPHALNDTYYIETHLDNKAKFDRIKHALELFGCENELMIRFSQQKAVSSNV